jgi:hypothetical protein
MSAENTDTAAIPRSREASPAPASRSAFPEPPESSSSHEQQQGREFEDVEGGGEQGGEGEEGEGEVELCESSLYVPLLPTLTFAVSVP